MEKVCLVSKDGYEEEYDVVLAYEDPNTKKGYLVYMKDKNDKNGDLFLASYDPMNENDLDLKEVETQEEKDMIMDLLQKI